MTTTDDGSGRNDEPSDRNAHDYSNDFKEDEDEYIDLADLSDEELEEICTSRGFQLVREIIDPATNATSDHYTHQDYVDAASECLQIEADLEEILQKHPEILQDVRRESERMRAQRDQLQAQLDDFEQRQQQQQQQNPAIQSTDSQKNERNNDTSDAAVPMQQTAHNKQDNGPIFELHEIIQETRQKIIHDFQTILNFIAPEPFRSHVLLPSIRTFFNVAKNTGVSVYDLTKRYLLMFVNRYNENTAKQQSKDRRHPQSNEFTDSNDIGENDGNGENGGDDGSGDKHDEHNVMI